MRPATITSVIVAVSSAPAIARVPANPPPLTQPTHHPRYKEVNGKKVVEVPGSDKDTQGAVEATRSVLADLDLGEHAGGDED